MMATLLISVTIKIMFCEYELLSFFLSIYIYMCVCVCIACRAFFLSLLLLPFLSTQFTCIVVSKKTREMSARREIKRPSTAPRTSTSSSPSSSSSSSSFRGPKADMPFGPRTTVEAAEDAKSKAEEPIIRDMIIKLLEDEMPVDLSSGAYNLKASMKDSKLTYISHMKIPDTLPGDPISQARTNTSLFHGYNDTTDQPIRDKMSMWYNQWIAERHMVDAAGKRRRGSLLLIVDLGLMDNGAPHMFFIDLSIV